MNRDIQIKVIEQTEELLPVSKSEAEKYLIEAGIIKPVVKPITMREQTFSDTKIVDADGLGNFKITISIGK